LAALHGQIAAYHFCDLEQMDNWSISDGGIRELDQRQGFDIGYFYVEARGREVAAWSQPLVNSRTDGHASLACRLEGDCLEVLVRIDSEPGLQTGKALLPSYLRYPGATSDQRPPLGKAIMQTTESDEGGRFYCDASRYEIVMASGDDEAEGVWLRVSELKWLLANSNLCSIQLRGLASMLLGYFVY